MFWKRFQARHAPGGSRASRGRIAVAAALTLAALLPALPAAGAERGYMPAQAAGYQVLDNNQKMVTDLQILERFVPYAESFWRDSDIPDPDTGRFLATGPGVSQPRGTGNVDFVYATLLNASPDQQSFSGVPRSVLLDHLIRSIRYTALTNVFSGAGYNQWGAGNTFEFSLETYLWGDAAHLIWNQLDPDTQSLVQRVVTAEADMLVGTPAVDAVSGDTGGETDAWDAPTPALAAVMFPGDPNRSAWEQTAIRFALNSSSIPSDESSAEVVDGKPLSDWITTANLHPDLTLENHGYFNISYQMVTHLLINDAAIFYAQAGRPQPQAFSFRTAQIWNKVIAPLTTDFGDLISPAGQDWVSKDFQHLDYLGALATRFQSPAASVLESRAVQLVASRQAGTGDGSITGESQLGYESHLAKRVASDWWSHKLFQPSPAPSEPAFSTDYQASGGVHTLSDVNVISGRFASASATMSWDPESPMGTWIPRSHDDMTDPVFTVAAPGSLFGTARGTPTGPYSCACQANEFATAGTVGSRDLAMAAFADGTTLLLDRGTGPTFTYYADQIPGLTGPRPVYSATGTGTGSLPGTWVDVADRMGMAVLGGGGITTSVQAAGSNFGSNDQILQMTGSASTGSGNRGAALYAGVGHTAMAALAGTAHQPAVPDGWSALQAQAPDGTGRLAVARWGGASSTTLTIGDDRGAPVPVEDATLSGTTATFPASLAAPSAEQETLRFFVRSDGPLQGRQSGDSAATLTNPGTHAVNAQVTYLAPDGSSQTVSRTLASGERVTARAVNGQLVLAGPEYEPLLAARSTAANLLASVSSWRQQGTISSADASRLTAAGQQILQDVQSAIKQALAGRPDTNAEAGYVGNAMQRAAAIAPAPGMPADVAAAITRAHDQELAELGQAQQALTVAIVVEPAGPVMPGEPFGLKVMLLNRGLGAATGGQLQVQPPPGWQMPQSTTAFSALPPGATAIVNLQGSASAATAPGVAVVLPVSVTYHANGQAGMSHGSVTVVPDPAYTITPATAQLPLARGGWNEISYTVHNNTGHALHVDLTAKPPPGVTVAPSATTLNLAAGGSGQFTVQLSGSSQTSGNGMLAVTGTSATEVTVSSSVRLQYSADLALNPSGSAWPAAFADSNQAAFPPSLATDGNPATFWVSGGPAKAGDGPTPQNPVALGADFGAPVTVATVTMIPRANYGPRAYTVQVSDDDQAWTTVAEVPSAANGAVTTSFTPVTARYLRLLITGSWDGTDRNVQVAELQPSSP